MTYIENRQINCVAKETTFCDCTTRKTFTWWLTLGISLNIFNRKVKRDMVQVKISYYIFM